MARATDKQIKAAALRYGKIINKQTRRRYGVGGASVLARLVKGESGGRGEAVSNANAKGYTQFIPSTRDYIKRKYGVDPYKNLDQAVHAAALYLKEGGGDLQHYNPGMASYTSYILGQRVGKFKGIKATTNGSPGPPTYTVKGGSKTKYIPPTGQPSQTIVDKQGAMLNAVMSTKPGANFIGKYLSNLQSDKFTTTTPDTFKPGKLIPGESTTLVAHKGKSGNQPQGKDWPVGRSGKPIKGKVTVAPGANRAGEGMSKEIMSLLNRVSAFGAKRITVGTGTNHNRMTVDGNVSDHWDGHAADLPVPIDSKRGDAVAAAAFRAVGVPAKQAMAQARKGGLYNVNWHGHRVQIIWKTNEGGNHHNHVHIGIR